MDATAFPGEYEDRGSAGDNGEVFGVLFRKFQNALVAGDEGKILTYAVASRKQSPGSPES
jgi:hypothetical protein